MTQNVVFFLTFSVIRNLPYALRLYALAASIKSSMIILFLERISCQKQHTLSSVDLISHIHFSKSILFDNFQVKKHVPSLKIYSMHLNYSSATSIKKSLNFIWLPVYTQFRTLILTMFLLLLATWEAVTSSYNFSLWVNFLTVYSSD